MAKHHPTSHHSLQALALFSPVASIFTFLAAMVYEHGGMGGTLKMPDLLQGSGCNSGKWGSGKLKGSQNVSLYYRMYTYVHSSYTYVHTYVHREEYAYRL